MHKTKKEQLITAKVAEILEVEPIDDVLEILLEPRPLLLPRPLGLLRTDEHLNGIVGWTKEKEYISLILIGGQIARGEDFLELFQGVLLVADSIFTRDRVDRNDTLILEGQEHVLDCLGIEELLDGTQQAGGRRVFAVACVEEDGTVLHF